MDELKYKCFNKACDYLANRPHSVHEIKTKLRGKTKRIFEDKLIDEVIEECLRLNFLDDEKFAEMYLEELKRSGRGWYYISQKLYKKGIAKDIISFLKEDNWSVEEEKEIIKEVAEKKLRLLRREKDFYKKKGKLYRYLVSRGFSSYIIGDIITSLMQED